MEQSPSYYDLLEVEAFADPDTVKSAYRKLARKYHPDMNPDNPQAERMFKKIGEAYTVLSDPDKRFAYDQTLATLHGVRPKRKTSTASPPPASDSNSKSSKSSPPPRSKASDKSDTGHHKQAETQSGSFKDMFDSLFRKDTQARVEEPERKAQSPSPAPSAKSSTKTTAKPSRGEDITVEALISREEAKEGVVKTVNVQHTELCKRCSGTGKVNGIPCSVCHGEKQLINLRKIDVRVPPGVKSGSKVRVAKEGGRGLAGGEAGDLFLAIKIAEEQSLKIDGLNVTLDLPITIPEAVLGAEVDVPTLHGKVKMVIPPQTSSGKVLKLKGQGVTLNGVTGDQYVTVYIVSPKTLSAKEKALYEELQRLQKDL